MGLQRDDNTREMWKVTIAMFLAGALTIFATLPSKADPDTSDHGALVVIAIVQVVCAAALWAAGPRRVLLRLSPFAGIVLISTIVAVAKPVGSVPFFYLWPVLAGAYYLSARDVVGVIALLCVSYGGALVISDEPQVKSLLFIGGATSYAVAAVIVSRLRTQRDAVMDELVRTAMSDPLTGLLNRRGFEAAFDRDLERARRSGEPLAVVVLDLDHFKLVNDRFGHAAGDDALRMLAGVLRDERRGGDATARIGGEEFAVVLLGSDAEGALRYIERVADAGARADGSAGPLSLSAGIAELGADLQSRDDLLLAADRALYAAKAAGRGRAAIHGDSAPMRPLAAAAAL
jgi:diguanylate cyclase (GGDEF)-like protein